VNRLSVAIMSASTLGSNPQDPVIGALDDHPAERIAVMDALHRPAPLPGRSLKGVTRGKNTPVLGLLFNLCCSGCPELLVLSRRVVVT
jgi:hypothetical protein